MSATNEDDDVKVVLEQTLLKVEEVFVYRIPPMMTSGGHHADDWNLATPLETCSLLVLRQDSALLVRLLSHKQKQGGPIGATDSHLFAQCKIQLDLSSSSSTTTTTQNSKNKSSPKPQMEHWVEAVVDSSRYFVIRISDESTKREAHIGIGFRERNDAMNFKMSLNEYENAIRKECMVSDIQQQQQQQDDNLDGTTNTTTSTSSSEGDGANNDNDTTNSTSLPMVSNLSLKEGEKIHVNIKGKKSTRTRKTTDKVTGGGSGLKPPMLLRKPPTTSSFLSGSSGLPPTSPTGNNATTTTDGTNNNDTTKSVYINTSGMTTNVDTDTIPPLSLADSEFGAACSTAAVAETSTMDDDDDDDEEWGEFQ